MRLCWWQLDVFLETLCQQPRLEVSQQLLEASEQGPDGDEGPVRMPVQLYLTRAVMWVCARAGLLQGCQLRSGAYAGRGYWLVACARAE